MGHHVYWVFYPPDLFLKLFLVEQSKQLEQDFPQSWTQIKKKRFRC